MISARGTLERFDLRFFPCFLAPDTATLDSQNDRDPRSRVPSFSTRASHVTCPSFRFVSKKKKERWLVSKG